VIKQTLSAALSTALLCVASAHSQEPSRAAFWTDNGKVLFWQTNLLAGNQGMCVVKFGFDGAALRQPIENLTLAIRVIDKAGADLGVEKLVLETFGASGAGRYTEAMFGVMKWPNQADGQWSPLCEEGTTLTVESAIGKQAGRVIDLVRFGQLEFTSFKKINVKLRK
jgi:interleukin receptor mimic protein A